MHVPMNIQERVHAKLEESIALAEAHYGTTFRKPTVLFTKRGTTAGTANYVRYEVNFNPILLVENVEAFIARTVPHEMAHLIDHTLHPENFESTVRMTRTGRWKRTKRDVHGRTFKEIMSVMGADGSRCHSFDTTRARVRTKAKHLWVCNHCQATMTLGPGRHKKMLAAGDRGAYRPRGKGCTWEHTYKYVGLEGAPAPVPEAAQTAAADKASERRSRREAKTSKLDKCRKLYDWTKSRQWNINQFVVGASCTTAGAATYYARIKKGD